MNLDEQKKDAVNALHDMITAKGTDDALRYQAIALMLQIQVAGKMDPAAISQFTVNV